MRKVKTNRRNRIFGLFAMFAMAIGVGVALAPREVVKTEAVKTFTINLDKKYHCNYVSNWTNRNTMAGMHSNTLKWIQLTRVLAKCVESNYECNLQAGQTSV